MYAVVVVMMVMAALRRKNIMQDGGRHAAGGNKLLIRYTPQCLSPLFWIIMPLGPALKSCGVSCRRRARAGTVI